MVKFQIRLEYIRIIGMYLWFCSALGSILFLFFVCSLKGTRIEVHASIISCLMLTAFFSSHVETGTQESLTIWGRWEVGSTGYPLSDQNILSLIHPKYNNWFCQIYEGLQKLLRNQIHTIVQGLQVLNFRTICLNLGKYDKISRH